MKVSIGAKSDVGRVRAANEDSYLVHEPLFVVADGMGGGSGGGVAGVLLAEFAGALDDAGVVAAALQEGK